MLNERNIVDALAKKAAEREKSQEVVIENIEEYKQALNMVFSTNEGKLVMKYLLRHSGIFNDDAQLDAAKLVEGKGRKSVYLKMIRPFLDKQLRMELESYD